MHSIQEVAAAAGVSSRTLRHYDAVGLLPALRDPRNGHRCYDSASLVRLQRIMLLRELGVGLARIAEVLDSAVDDAVALREHLEDLRAQQRLLDRRMDSVTRTLRALENEEDLMAGDVFDGFDHTQYRDEVEARWGARAYADGDRWWRGLGPGGRRDFESEGRSIAARWRELADEGVPPDSGRALDLAARHARWVGTAWGGGAPDGRALAGLGEMYVTDERFAAYYRGAEAAGYVRDALVAYARSGGQHAG